MTANPVSVELQQLSVLPIKHVDQNECPAFFVYYYYYFFTQAGTETPFIAIRRYVPFVTATTI